MIRSLALCPALAAASLALATPAFAHAVLIASTPASDGTIPAGHEILHLRYNSRIDQERSRVWLSTPGHPRTVLPIAAPSEPDEIDVPADLSPGPVTLHWQVLAIDGHITRGDVAFTVAPANP